MEEKAQKLDKLEQTLLDIGVEVYSLRNEIATLQDSHKKFVDIMDGLRKILDEKGVINLEDFDGAVDLGKALTLTGGGHFDPSVDLEIEKIKKITH